MSNLEPTEQEMQQSEWTTKFAWLPTKTPSGNWIWLSKYVVKK